MANTKTDNQNFGLTSSDQERDIAAKGAPTTGLGIPDDKHSESHPYDEDIQTQLAAKSTQKKGKTTRKDEE